MALRRLKRKTTWVYVLDLRIQGKRYIRSLHTKDPAKARVRYHKLAARLMGGAEAETPEHITLGTLSTRILSHAQIASGPSNLVNTQAALAAR